MHRKNSLTDGPKTRDGGGRRASVGGRGKEKAPAREEQGMREKEASGRLGVRFVALRKETGPSQDGAAYGHDWGDGGLARVLEKGEGRGGPRQVRAGPILHGARQELQLARPSPGKRVPFAKLPMWCLPQKQDLPNPLNPMPRSTSCVRQDGEDGWVLQSNLPASRVPISTSFASCDPRAGSNDRPQCPSPNSPGAPLSRSPPRPHLATCNRFSAAKLGLRQSFLAVFERHLTLVAVAVRLLVNPVSATRTPGLPLTSRHDRAWRVP